uniref:hypothetical protein n=1 Tax=Candidatus Enterovibrio escicola TaxID=1927127 RepID=UPI0018F1C252|nr:hypothetical protein [Candidatus Enterovibrio escacola]
MPKLRSDRLKNYLLHKDVSINNLDAIFIDVDDYCQIFLPAWENTSFLSVSNKETTFLASLLAK